MRYFEDVTAGEEIGIVEFGPVTIIDTVRWAGVQENWEQVHWDRAFARDHSRLRTFIASGSYRQALLARMLTDWVGPRGVLRKLRVRHTAPTFEGDLIRYGGRVVEKSSRIDDPWVACDLEGKNQGGEPILVGHCVLQLPSRGACEEQPSVDALQTNSRNRNLIDHVTASQRALTCSQSIR